MDLIERLRRCGIPEQTVLRICLDFLNRDKMNDLARYVETEERERGLA